MAGRILALTPDQTFFCEPNPSPQRTSIRAERRNPIRRALGKELFVELTAPTLLSLNSVTKVFTTDEVETHALAGIELNVRKGEYIGQRLFETQGS